MMTAPESPETGRRLKFNLFMSGSDGFVPDLTEGRKSNFVDLPNGEFAQPLLTQQAMDKYLSTMVMGEKLGFDSLMTFEQRTPGVFSSAMILASWLLARTNRIPVGAVGPVINTYLSPLKLAEEIAILDLMSAGRFYVGFPFGIGTAYHQMGVNPVTARAKYREGVALVKRALSEPGPFEHRGEFYHLPISNIYPRPLHMPDIWIPAAGSRESLELAASGRHTYMAILNPRKALIRSTTTFREIAEEHGYTSSPDQIAPVLYIHVAESDAQARREAEHHILWNNQSLMRSPFHDAFPPGYTSVASLKGMLAGGYRSKPLSEVTYDEMIDEGMAIIGSPETVIRGLERMIDELGAGQVVVMGDSSSMPEWMSRKGMTMLAREVMPHFRPPGARPVWQDQPLPGARTESEAAAISPAPPRTPIAAVPGLGRVDIRTAHVDELRVPLDD